MNGGELNIGPLLFWSAAITTFLNAGLGVYNLLTAGSRRQDKRIDDHEKRFDSHSKRIEIVERRLERLDEQLARIPTPDALHRLEIAITNLSGDMKAFDERLKPVAAIADRMQELMLKERY